jgi:hypothetical protein
MTQSLRSIDPSLLGGTYIPTAVYFTDSDCVEYVKEDVFCVYERVDKFLTLIFDETKLNLIGFKLKGFRCLFEKHLKPLFELHDKQFHRPSVCHRGSLYSGREPNLFWGR